MSDIKKVLANVPQDLSAAEKLQARQNIGVPAFQFSKHTATVTLVPVPSGEGSGNDTHTIRVDNLKNMADNIVTIHPDSSVITGCSTDDLAFVLPTLTTGEAYLFSMTISTQTAVSSGNGFNIVLGNLYPVPCKPVISDSRIVVGPKNGIIGDDWNEKSWLEQITAIATQTIETGEELQSALDNKAVVKDPSEMGTTKTGLITNLAMVVNNNIKWSDEEHICQILVVGDCWYKYDIQ